MAPDPAEVGSPVRNRGVLRPIGQLLGLVRKELGDVLRQPRLILVLVFGPFVILLLFAGGYDEQQVVLRTLFVASPDSIYAEAIEEHEDELDRYLVNDGFTEDLGAARAAVADGEADLVVVFPPDPADTVLNGEQATIAVLHDKIDPIQKTAVEVSAQLAVLELNASILEALVGETQDALVPLSQSVARVSELSADLVPLAEVGDGPAAELALTDLRAALADIERIVAVSDGVATELQAEVDDDRVTRVEELQATLAELDAVTERMQQTEPTDPTLAADARLASDLIAELELSTRDVLTLDPELIVRPFVSDTESLLKGRVSLEHFFAPSALALLLQHVVVTFAAMALVRDEAFGLFEIYRVSPVVPAQVVLGKYVSFLVIGGFVAVVSVFAVIGGLGVPLRGSAGWVVGSLLLMLAASIGLGLTLSGAARTEIQAVQYAMLVLLTGLFFSGFFISLDTLRYPIKLISWLLPVTFGIKILQDVMLRGISPGTADVTALVVQTLAYGGLGAALVWRRLRVE